MKEKENFIKRLKEVRGEESFANFALKCGKSERAVRKYEKGESDPTRLVLLKIASAFNVTVGWLANGEEPKHPQTVRQGGNGEIAATISPESARESNHVEEGRGPAQTGTNVHMKHILGWMEEEIAKDDDKALFFYEDIKARYPSFEEYMEKKRPSANSAPGPGEKENRKLA